MSSVVVWREDIVPAMTRTVALPVVLAAVALTAGCATARYGRARLPERLPPADAAISDAHRIEIGPQRVELTRDYLAIHQPAVAAALPPGDGAEAIAFVPRLIVVHYTAIPTLEATLATFAPLEIAGSRELIRRNGLLNVGIQFIVDRDGTIYASYPETAIARHTIGLNHVAIGIENVGDDDLDGKSGSSPLTAAQLEANVALIRYLAAKYPTIDWVIGHSEYRDLEDLRHPAHALFSEAVDGYRTEKSDPGKRFLKRLRRELRSSPRRAN